MKSSLLAIVALLVGLGAISVAPALARDNPPSYSANSGGGGG
jgi:hypothetical protein